MLTQQDIYAAGSENCTPMLNKENYVPWSSRLLRYAKSRPNGKLIHKSIINGPYVRRMIPEPGDPNREVPVNKTFHVQTDDELTEKDLNRLKLMIKPFRLFFSQMMKGSDTGIQEKKAKLFNEWERNGNLVAACAEGNATGHNGIHLEAEEFDLMAAAADLDEIKEVNANCILMANLQKASTSGTHG
nr:hypothetical protein [Tanacetum cinerariifolium]